VFLLRNYETKQGKRKDIVSLVVALKRYDIPYARRLARSSGPILPLRQRYSLCKTFGNSFRANTATSTMVFLMKDVRKKGIFFMKREKTGRCFFRLRLKIGTYDNFTLHKEIYYIMNYIVYNCSLYKCSI
jgi:hypothetical protein